MRAICFHGIGRHTPSTFADAAMKRLGQKVPGLVYASCHWSPLLDVPQQAMLADMRRRGSRANLTQAASYTVLGDALAYRNVEGAVRLLAEYEVQNLGGVDLVVAHSLGCVLAWGWLNARRSDNPITFITTGCNFGLWHAGSVEKLHKPRGVGRWLNFWDATDALGGPIAGFTSGVRDIEVDLKGPWYSWLVPGSDHVGFWGDKDLWSRIVPMHLGHL